MAVYLGDSGQVTLSRDSGNEWLATTLDAADVNVNQRRFSVNFYSNANRGDLALEQQTDSILNFITGDRVEIRTVAVNGTRPNLGLIPGWTDPSITRFVYVDQAGGMRLYENFADSLEGSVNKALSLQAPTAAQQIEVKTVNSTIPRCLAEVVEYEITTSRDTIDTTILSSRYRQQYENGLIQGQGRLRCFWKHDIELCDPNNCYTDTGAVERYPEVSMYLAQLVLRLDQGSDFHGYFWIYRDPENDDQSIWYDAPKCIITNCVVSVVSGAIIETTIEFISSGRVQLKQGIIPDRLLLEGTPIRADQAGYVTDEFEDKPIEQANKADELGP